MPFPSADQPHRVTAHYIIRCRNMLVLKELAKLKEDLMLLRQAEARFNDAWEFLPLIVRRQYVERLYKPTERLINREGFLNLNGRIHL